MKKIWIINHHANNMLFDEGGRHYSIAKYLRLNGYEPTIFCSNAIHGKGDYYYKGNALWTVHKAEKIGVSFVFVKSRKYIGNGKDRILGMVDFYFNMIRTAKQYAKKYGKPDVIIGSSVHPLAVLAGEKIAKRFGIPCICEIRDLWPESIFAYFPEKRTKWYAKLLYFGEKMMYKRADKIVMTWPGGKDYIKERGWLKELGEDKIFHISNGVDLESFKQMAECSKAGIDVFDDGYYNIVYAGSIRTVNNLAMLVDTAKNLQKNPEAGKIRLIIYGDGNEREELQSRCIKENIDNIEFRGRVNKKDIPAILTGASCTIMHNTSSVLDRFGQSQNKFFEYLAAGKPVIMTYSVGYSICSTNGCGIEVKEQNAGQIAEAIMEMNRYSEKEYQEICERAKRTAQKYDYKQLTNQYIGIIENFWFKR